MTEQEKLVLQNDEDRCPLCTAPLEFKFKINKSSKNWYCPVCKRDWRIEN